MIGVASLPNGNACCWFAAEGVPTRSMITLVVSQNDAVIQVRTQNLGTAQLKQLTEREP